MRRCSDQLCQLLAAASENVPMLPACSGLRLVAVALLLACLQHGGGAERVTITPEALRTFYEKHAPKWAAHADTILAQLDHGDLLVALKEKFGEGPVTVADTAAAQYVPDQAAEAKVQALREAAATVKAAAEKLAKRRDSVHGEYLSTHPDSRQSQEGLLRALDGQVKTAWQKAGAAENELNEAIKQQQQDEALAKAKLVADEQMAGKEAASVKQVQKDYERAQKYAIEQKEKKEREERKAAARGGGKKGKKKGADEHSEL